MQKRGKLELTWVGKYDEKKIEPRILVEDKSKSYGDPNSENMLIHGDNLIALQALQQDYAGKIKCIYIDPPYNTGSAFEHYDDGTEHSIWLSLMKHRLELLRNLLTEDGSIYINIDFNECHYLKVLMDEVFGRDCFQREIIWRIGWLSGFKTAANNYIRNHDTILYYTKNPDGFYFDKEKAYNTPKDFQERFNDASKKEIIKKLIDLGVSKQEADEFFDFVATVGLPKRYPLEDTWNSSIYDKLNSIAVVSFSGEKVSKMLGSDEFKGQKAEALIKRILSISTQPGDLVLDSFLGTGTTSAVAQKMGRRWIGIEMGNQAYELAKPRLDKVIDGTDQSGISKSVDWHGGGGYHFYELAPSLLVKNEKLPVYQINPEYTFEMLCEAICKIEGFHYQPDGIYHGHSSEKRFIHITKEFVNAEYVMSVAATLGEGQSLLIYGTKIQSDMRLPDNIEVKKIPKDLLEKCDFESEVR